MAAATLAPSHVVLLAALSTVAAGYDVWRRRIPNWLTVGIAASGMAAQAVAFGARGAGSAVLSVLLVLVLLTAMWRFRLIGGGDAVGGLIALACYAAAGASSRAAVHVNLSRLRAPSLDEIGRQPGAVLVPYGAAFAVAALVVVLS